ncbi:phage tail fiber protein [Scardovia inopinata]|uniref:Tail spike domain-containing protein n=1 Tax=Scardovia inopinata F0304 TaxID=641146 RepID=W5IJV4_SCAIO|nr:phage tail protein [Scardovia inopinata]EFG27142.1 hypothetical protein HMPREF9020_00780 [Scardovia inopinata F0304]BAR06756.1 hypothetical phage protein [Scardovia inopinata JCM 12537]SUV50816.1 phage tail fiber protein [Scardovia inopinata]
MVLQTNQVTLPTSVSLAVVGKAHDTSTIATLSPADKLGFMDDKQQLLAETKAELKRRSTPTVSYEADVLTLAKAGMDTAGVALGDRVLLVDTTFTPDLRLAGRVLQLEEDLLDPALTVITIGNIIERFTASSHSAEQRLDRVIAGTATWQSTSQQVTQNASKWDQVAQTVVDNSDKWNTAAATLEQKSASWDNTSATLANKQPTWDTTAETVTAKSGMWDDAAVIAANHAQAIRQSTSGVTLHYENLAITLGDSISITDATGTWTFTDGAFVKQDTTE